MTRPDLTPADVDKAFEPVADYLEQRPKPIGEPEYMIRVLDDGKFYDPSEGDNDLSYATHNLVHEEYAPKYVNGRYMIWAHKLTPMSDGTIASEDCTEQLAAWVRDYCDEQDLDTYPDWTDPDGHYRQERDRFLREEDDPYCNPGLRHPDQR